MKVGFVGLGKMGLAIAKNLQKAGHELAVYNRTASKAEPLRAQGARVAETPRDAAEGAEVVFTMLADDHALEEVCFGETGILAGLEPRAIHVSASTISVALSERLTEAHTRLGQGYVAAPVFGRPDAAEAKQLWVVAAGTSSEVERCRPLLEAIGRGLSVLGQKPSSANVVKLSGNFLIASMIEALGESFALTRKAGVEPKVFLEVFQSVFARSPIFERYATLVANEQYHPPGFAFPLGLKDIGLVLQAAGNSQVSMPLASLLRDHFVEGLARDLGELDWTALALLAAQRAGLSKA
ncbi:NAD(P)-dependent oxidoreductase [Hyalangium versicolor]|uniref:NAD(P)-dependent oxidoreductase n=1 Tax=Hyalangium versicolor TaxID=2861190 RepID=UPI001CC98C3E|nr:NAD(P)-dependent oxidoreductase [Hyalangium versicolor]